MFEGFIITVIVSVLIIKWIRWWRFFDKIYLIEIFDHIFNIQFWDEKCLSGPINIYIFFYVINTHFQSFYQSSSTLNSESIFFNPKNWETFKTFRAWDWNENKTSISPCWWKQKATPSTEKTELTYGFNVLPVLCHFLLL